MRTALSARDPACAACRHRALRSHARDGAADGIRPAGREFPGRLTDLRRQYRGTRCIEHRDPRPHPSIPLLLRRLLRLWYCFQPYSAGAVTKPTAAAPATQTVIEQKELNFG